MGERPQEIGWVVWNFDRATGKDAWVAPHIPEAIAAFEADYETGEKAAQWLRTESGKASSDSVKTWLYYDARFKRIEAFFAVRKTDELEETSRLSPGQPLEVATEIVWFCKHSKAELDGKKLMAWAVHVAVGLWKDAGYPAGTLVTVLLNPQGADTTKLRKKYSNWKEVPGRDLLVSQFEVREDLPPRTMGG